MIPLLLINLFNFSGLAHGSLVCKFSFVLCSSMIQFCLDTTVVLV